MKRQVLKKARQSGMTAWAKWEDINECIKDKEQPYLTMHNGSQPLKSEQIDVGPTSRMIWQKRLNEGKLPCRYQLGRFDLRPYCARHAPIVIENPRCDSWKGKREYTNGEPIITVYPAAFCPCGDYE